MTLLRSLLGVFVASAVFAANSAAKLPTLLGQEPLLLGG
jgi:hypothetical protein